MADRDVSVVLSARVDGYKRAMDEAARATDKVGTSARKAGTTGSTIMDRARVSAEKYDDRMRRLGQASQFAGAAILTGLGIGLVRSTESASRLNETVNKSQVLFGSASARMEEWAATAAQSMGLSKQAALESAAGFGDMFQQLGWAQDEAANMSQSVVKLAADLGSFNNLPTAEVSEMISAGFRGEYDSLQRLIPNINAARVEKEALAATGKSVASSLTAQEKAAATLAIITKDGARANDDFARTADSAANAQKIAAAEFENAKAALGESLTPAMSKAAQAASSILSGFNSLPGPVRTLAVVVTAAAGAFLFLAPKIAAAKASLSSFGVSASGVGKSAAFATLKLAAMAAAGTAITSALETKVNEAGLASELEKFGKSGEIAGEAAKVFGDDLTKLQGDLSFMLTPNWYDSATKGVGKLAAALGMFSTEGDISQQISKVDEALAGLASRDPGSAAAAFDRIEDAAAQAEVPIEELTALFPAYTAAAAQSATSGSTPAAAGVKSVADAAAAANGNVDEFAKKLEALIAPGMAASKAADAQKDSLNALADAAKANGTALSGNGAKARANREAFRGAIQSNVDLATAYARLNGSVDQGKAKYDEASAALVRAGVKARFSEKQIRAFIDSMNAAGDTKATPKVGANITELKAKESDVKARLRALGRMTQTPKVKAETAQAKRELALVREQLAQVRDKEVTLTIRKESIGASVGAASGGYIQAPGFAQGGGPVRGPGTRKSDSIPAMLSNGEYVVQAEAVDHYGVGFFDRVNARKFAKGGRVRPRATYTNQKSYDRALKEWEAADQLYQDRVNARESAKQDRTRSSEQTRSSFRASSGLMTFDFGASEAARGAYVAAVKDQAAAETALFEARKKANTANRADRPEAIRALAEAQRTYADSVKATATAQDTEARTRPTAENIRNSMATKVATMRALTSNLQTLAGWGMPSVLLAEILNAGLDSGAQMAQALIDGGPGLVGGFQTLGTEQTNLGNVLGSLNAAWNPGDGDLTLDQLVAATTAAVPGKPGPKPVYKKKGKKRALGGPVRAGEPYLVGEQGMEMFVPGMSGAIVPNRSLQHAIPVGAGVGGGDVTFSGPCEINMDGVRVWSGLLTANRRTGFSLRPLDGS